MATNKLEGYFNGKLLIATPTLKFSCFEKSVIYVCVHDAMGAMGLIINQTVSDVDIDSIFKHFDIKTKGKQIVLPIYFGGPVESARGFVLHSSEYKKPGVMHENNQISLSSNVDILSDIAAGNGPEQKLFALGYAGWGPGQLEQEIESNSWLVADAKPELVFEADNAVKWELSARETGIRDLFNLSTEAGHA